MRRDIVPASGAVYHVTPLHYLPHIASTGALWAKSVLGGMGIAPRRSAFRRDRMLGLADYIHFYTEPGSPLLADKITKGYPHVVLVFDIREILGLPGAAAIPCNTKCWRHREAFRPITDRCRITELLKAHALGKNPSLEVLARYAVGLESLRAVLFINAEERTLAEDVLRGVGLTWRTPLVVDPTAFPNAVRYRPATLDAASRYFAECRLTHAVAPPPKIPFD